MREIDRDIAIRILDSIERDAGKSLISAMACDGDLLSGVANIIRMPVGDVRNAVDELAAFPDPDDWSEIANTFFGALDDVPLYVIVGPDKAVMRLDGADLLLVRKTRFLREIAGPELDGSPLAGELDAMIADPDAWCERILSSDSEVARLARVIGVTADDMRRFSDHNDPARLIYIVSHCLQIWVCKNDKLFEKLSLGAKAR